MAGGGNRRPLLLLVLKLPPRWRCWGRRLLVLDLALSFFTFLPFSFLSFLSFLPSSPLSPGPSLLSWSSEVGGTTTVPAGVTSTLTNVGSLAPSNVTRPM